MQGHFTGRVSCHFTQGREGDAVKTPKEIARETYGRMPGGISAVLESSAIARIAEAIEARDAEHANAPVRVKRLDWKEFYTQWLNADERPQNETPETCWHRASKLYAWLTSSRANQVEAAPASLVPEHVIEVLKVAASDDYNAVEKTRTARECLKKLGVVNG
jgi:hypothetical protein